MIASNLTNLRSTMQKRKKILEIRGMINEIRKQKKKKKVLFVYFFIFFDTKFLVHVIYFNPVHA